MKKLISIAITSIFAVAILTTTSSAYFRATWGGSTDYPSNWIQNIRHLEAEGEGLGLKETIDPDTLEATTANNIDAHLMKNTEYGAIMLLAASTQYGKQPISTDSNLIQNTRWVKYTNNGSSNINDKRTNSTTGNDSGIFITSNDWKSVAAVFSSIDDDEIFYNKISSRYIDKYRARSVNVSRYRENGYLEKDGKNGDAFLEVYLSNGRPWRNVHDGADAATNEGQYLLRGADPNNRNTYEFYFSHNPNNSTFKAYAVIVNGEGLK